MRPIKEGALSSSSRSEIFVERRREERVRRSLRVDKLPEASWIQRHVEIREGRKAGES